MTPKNIYSKGIIQVLHEAKVLYLIWAPPAYIAIDKFNIHLLFLLKCGWRA